MNSQLSWRKGWQLVCCTALPIAARMCVKNSGELMCSESSLRLLSFHAGSVLWKTPGVDGAPYQPTPKPSPLVGSAPSREWRLWLTGELGPSERAWVRRVGEPERASHRHMVRSLVSGSVSSRQGSHRSGGQARRGPGCPQGG